MTTLQDALDIDSRFPVIQAPMADVQDSELAIAVANAGGLGSLPCAMSSPEQMRKKFFNRTSLRAASRFPDRKVGMAGILWNRLRGFIF